MGNVVRMLARYASRLPAFLWGRLESAEGLRLIQLQLAQRTEAFLHVVEHGVFANPASVYRHLFHHAGLKLEDVVILVRQWGVEGALARLHDAGVYITADEFKGRRPIERPGLRLEVEPAAFDNPLLSPDLEVRSGGSRGVGTRNLLDLDLLTYEAAHIDQYLRALGVGDRPFALWRSVPPVAAGIKSILRRARLGLRTERWFSHTPTRWRNGQTRFALFTSLTLLLGRLLGHRLPSPQHVPLADVHRVVRWLADRKHAGTPAVLDTSVSSAVHVCLAAHDLGLDIAGTFFRVGGEPFTPARMAILAAAGCRGVCHYSFTEAGILGVPCAAGAAPDDVHVLSDKVALIQRRPRGGGPAEALVATTLLPSGPKLLLNVETGDMAALQERDCGCSLGQLGLRTHLTGIRSYEKLTSEGVTFLGTELLRLVEEVLPAHFGGRPTDYQLAEEDEAGLPRVSVIASPRLGPLDEGQVVEVVQRTLAGVPGGEIMVEHWRQAQTLRLVRRDPVATQAGKIQTLHVSSRQAA